MLLMIDNYDSFTYNLVQYFGELGSIVKVIRNDECTIADIIKFNPDQIVISPGPCTPLEAGISIAVIQEFAGRVPILGVCLGHQAIGQAFGGKIIRAPYVMHGKTSLIYHNSIGLFNQISNPFEATRYHSLIIDQKYIPDCLEITAWTKNINNEKEIIMGVQHRELAVYGVQFHPESILTQYGHNLLQNFLNLN